MPKPVPEPQPRTQPSPTPKTATFQLVEMPPESTGVDFLHVSGNSAEKPFPAANGSGVGALDYDRDGLVDIYFATGTHFPLDPARREPANKIYRNRGDWKLNDVTAGAGMGHAGYSSGIAVGDYDCDGFPDVYVTCFGDDVLYRNMGDGTCENVPVIPGGNFSTSAAFLDYDADGLLDLYVGNYGKWSWEENKFCGDKARNVRIFCSPKSLEPESDRLLRNLGDGSFQDATADAGVDVVNGRAQGVLSTDIDGDGRVDLYIGNDIHPNFMFMNSGGGKFAEVGESVGAAFDQGGQMQAGMGVAGADVNRDGLWDLFVTNFEDESHTLYLQTAPSNFYDVSATHGITAPSKPWVGWGVAFVDFDLDEWKDLIVTNGHVDDNLKEMGQNSPYEEPALVWKNADGRFDFLGDAVGGYFERPHPGRGLATADFDNDGDCDVVIVHQDRQPALLRNDVATTGDSRPSSLSFRLIGTRSNRDAIGARVEIKSRGAPRIEQVQGGGSYLSAPDLRLIVAAPRGESTDVEIVWPSGIRSAIEGLQPDREYTIIEPFETGSLPQYFAHPYAPTKAADHD